MLRRRRPRSSARRRRGQALVEFAIVLPAFLLILMLVLDFGRIVYAYYTITQGAQEAERAGVVGAETAMKSATDAKAKYAAIRQATKNMSPGVPVTDAAIGGPTVSPDLKSCTAAGLPADDPIMTTRCFYPDGVDSGDRIFVRIQVTVPLLTPIISNVVGGSYTLTATSIGYIP